MLIILEIDQVYHQLAVTGFSHAENWAAYWDCVCECGESVVVTTTDLRRGGVKMCKTCREKAHAETARKSFTTHGQYLTKEYKTEKARKRKELTKDLDYEWSLELERALRAYFPDCVVCGGGE